jgi:uncharacterized membrane protein YkoI
MNVIRMAAMAPRSHVAADAALRTSLSVFSCESAYGRPMHAKLAATAVAGAALAAGVAVGAGGTTGSRMDDGKDLRPKAGITEPQAIAAARTAATGAIGEIDLEHADGRLVYNVDVGAADVKVDAANGRVLRVDHDD